MISRHAVYGHWDVVMSGRMSFWLLLVVAKVMSLFVSELHLINGQTGEVPRIWKQGKEGYRL